MALELFAKSDNNLDPNLNFSSIYILLIEEIMRHNEVHILFKYSREDTIRTLGKVGINSDKNLAQFYSNRLPSNYLAYCKLIWKLIN